MQLTLNDWLQIASVAIVVFGLPALAMLHAYAFGNGPVRRRVRARGRRVYVVR